MSIATSEQSVVDSVNKQLFIGGEWREASGGETLAVEDPSTAEPLCEIADATPEDAMAALAAADEAQAEWSKHPPRERGEILRRAFEKLVERTDELALLMTLEMGKALAESKAEITYAAEFFRWFSEEAVRIEGRYAVPPAGAGRMLTMKQPVGPCLFITPWNFPMAMGTRKIGPAIAAGCTMVMKPAQQTPLSMLALAGIAPFLVFDDADVDAAVEGAMVAKMRNIGEACTAANRFHVADGVAGEFAEKLAKRMEAMKVGRGTEEDVEVGPLIDGDQREKVADLVDDALGKGARALVGAEKMEGSGYFYRPTVLDGIPEDATLLKEEIFGPVAPVASFGSEEEAVAAANDTEYGLVAYVYTSDLGRALRVCEGLETGMVGLNQGMVSNASAPFGGIKHSGFGREGGKEGIEEYLETKYVAINL